MTILAYKYEVDYVRAEALARLERIIPLWMPGTSKTPPIALRPEDYIGLVNLARTFNLPRLLLPALLTCCHLPLQDLALKASYGNGQFEQLSQNDLRLCLRAVDTLSKTNTSRLNLFLDFLPGERCVDPDQCMDSIHNVTRAASAKGCFTSVYILRPIEIYLPELNNLCDCCRRILIYQLCAYRKATWTSLGQIFEIEAWPPVEHL